MNEHIHDVEVDTSGPIVESLLAAQCPDLTGRQLTPLSSSGTDNAMWRTTDAAGNRFVVRLPRTETAAQGVSKELAVLPHLAASALTDIVAVPTIHHVGSPTDVFGLPWAVLDWIDGDDAWNLRSALDPSSRALALTLASVVDHIRNIDGLPITERRPGDRGGPLRPLLARLDHWLDDPAWGADDLIDIAAVRRCRDQCAGAGEEPVQMRPVHGDLIPGNLIFNDDISGDDTLSDHRLVAVIDWSGIALADPAQDLAPAWSILGSEGRAVFGEALDVDESSWLRGRAFELEHAVGGIVYYAPRQHPLADVMRRTLDQILAES